MVNEDSSKAEAIAIEVKRESSLIAFIDLKASTVKSEDLSVQLRLEALMEAATS